MKTMIKGLALALVGAALLAAPALRAEEAPAPDPSPGHTWGQRQPIDFMKKKLGLSDEQAEQWKKALQGQRESGKILRDKLMADRANLAVLVDEKASEGQLKDALAGLEKDGQALQQQRLKHRDALKAILSPLQQAKLLLVWGGLQGRGGMHGGQSCGWQGHRGFDGHRGRGPGAWGHQGSQEPPEAAPVPDDAQNN